MAVYTKLTEVEISRHLKDYNIGNLVKFTEIIEGIDNSNFILETEKGKFILTIFESRINKDELSFFINFKKHLSENGIPCPAPILNNQGFAIVDLKNKKSVILSFLNGKSLKTRSDGYYDNITKEHCFEVGKILGKLHEAAKDFTQKRENDLGVNCFRALFSKFESMLENYQKNLGKEILEELNFLEKSWKTDLPSKAAHLDLFPDNVFFDEDKKLVAVIDFYFAANDALVYDFAACVNAWCFDENNVFQKEKFENLILGYEKVREFSQAEKDFLPIALRAASMRFLLTRLHDMFFTPKDSLVKIKNPQEYLSKLRFFQNDKI